MLIGELVRRTGFSRDTIRFYEKKGLIQVERKERRHNNYKEYSTDLLERLLKIKRLKGLGLTLNEIADILDMIQVNAATCNRLESKMQEKMRLIDKKIAELQWTKARMQQGIDTCRSCHPPGSEEENCLLINDDHFFM